MKNNFDRILKENIEALFSIFAKREGISLEHTEELKDKLQVTLEREADFLKKILHQNAKDDFILHIELQTGDEMKMLARLLLYRAILYHKYGLAVHQIVIFLGEKPSLMETILEQNNLMFKFTLVNMCELDSHIFLNGNTPEEVVMAILADFKGENTETVILKILTRLKELSSSPLSFSKYTKQLHVLSNLRNLQLEIIKNLNHMPISVDFSNDPLYIEGIEKGIEKGLQKGALKTAEEAVVRMLQRGYSMEQITDVLNVTVSFVLDVQKKLKKKK
jgi:predicted transposase/invertase (TIGR01784 family)